MENVLIAGGTGLVGTRLTELLLERGYTVSYLSRQKSIVPYINVHRWDPDKGYIEEGALEAANHIVLLAGTGIADERWSDQRKQEIISSRTRGIDLIASELQNRSYQIKSCIAASGIGFYGADTGQEHLSEDDASGTDFVANVTRHWENSSAKIANIGIRTATLRIGVVLSNKGGALPKMLAPIKGFIGSPLGSGRQWLSWIHIDDLCHLIIHAIENPQWQGVFNAVADQPVTNADFMRHIATTIGRPMFLPNVPGFVLRLILDEMADLILGGNYVLNKKIYKKTNFKFQYNTIESALNDLL
jgi:uncharacterized protein